MQYIKLKAQSSDRQLLDTCTTQYVCSLTNLFAHDFDLYDSLLVSFNLYMIQEFRIKKNNYYFFSLDASFLTKI